MPNSKKRQTHKPHQDFIPHKPKTKSSVPVAMAFCAIAGLGIAFFAAGSSVIWLPIGLILGLGIGYLIGKQMDRGFNK